MFYSAVHITGNKRLCPLSSFQVKREIRASSDKKLSKTQGGHIFRNPGRRRGTEEDRIKVGRGRKHTFSLIPVYQLHLSFRIVKKVRYRLPEHGARV